ncbi:MAG: hypothetical protein ACEPOV_13970 [Hyphomicrobiales bacterium]
MYNLAKSLITGYLILSVLSGHCEEEKKTKDKFGKPIIKVFANYHTIVSGESNKSAFEIKRAYLGHSYKIDSHFSTIVKLDIGSPNDASQYALDKRYAYFKNAALIYKYKNLKLQAGLIDVYQFKFQEKFWGHRYIEKSFMDKYKFGSSADIGFTAKYKSLNWLSSDLTVVNGEGYKHLQEDNTYKIGLGITFSNILTDGIFFRIYGDLENKKRAQYTNALFLGYKLKDKFNIGIEYNIKQNCKYKDHYSMYGTSIYSSFSLFKKWEIFARYDYLESNEKENDGVIHAWNIDNDGTYLVGGVQYKPVKGVRMALNYQGWMTNYKELSDKSFIYLNLEYKLP